MAVGPAGARERGVARLRQWLASRSGLYLISGGIGLIAAWVAVGFIGQVTTGAQLERRVVAYRAEITAIAATNTAIARMVGYAASPAYAERVARETLGYAREGDVVLLPARLQQAATPTAATRLSRTLFGFSLTLRSSFRASTWKSPTPSLAACTA